MKNQVVSSRGSYFVAGSGFVGSLKTATRLTSEEAAGVQQCARNMGINNSVVTTVVTSYAVNYIRSTDLVNGQVQPNCKNPSKRRFATKDEAVQHGSRFGARRANAGDAEGTAGHIGFYVTETSDPVNAEINWKTGLTNPLGQNPK